MKLHIYTQDQENYGAHDWDGEGEVPQYWKSKGGTDFIISVEGFCWDDVFTDKKLRMIVDSLRDKIEENSLFFRREILGYNAVEDDFLTDFEQSQLEYDGVIVYEAKRMGYDELMALEVA
jgi:hypothetical protein